LEKLVDFEFVFVVYHKTRLSTEYVIKSWGYYVKIVGLGTKSYAIPNNSRISMRG
jgi:hypothetical protein